MENKTEQSMLNKRELLEEYEYSEMKMWLQEEKLVSTFNKAQMVLYNDLLKKREIYFNKASRIYKNIFEID